MSDPKADIRKWTTAVMVMAIVYTAIALLILVGGGSNGVIVGVVVLCAVLLWAGFGLVKSGSYGPAQGCLIVAGVLGLPLGLVAILAGINIKKAADSLGAGPNW